MLVGPVVKIDPATLPVGHNIHYMGGRHYKELPAYIKGWDVCLMPFAMNEATRYISPTKVLEYMAAGKPIVSTPITDVIEPYGNIVRIGGTPDEFIAQCEAALANDEDDWSVRKTGAEAILSATSWNKTAEAMETLMERGTKEKYHTGIVSARQPAVVIAGAGPAGLSAAYHLGDKALLIEQNERVGGGCRSVTQDGFTFDQAGNVMFSDEPYVHEMYKVLLGENVHWQDREAWIHTHGVHTRYPFQGSLHGLPAQVVQECLVGAIEARFGTMKPAAPTGGHSNGGHSNGGTATEKNGSAGKNATSDALSAVPPSQHAPVMSEPPRNLEEFIQRTWGAGIARHFAIPYNQKLWTVPLAELDTSWLAGKVPMPNLEEIIEGAFKPASKPAGPNARFGYPLRGGLQALMDGFVPHLKGTVMLGTRIDAINPANRTMNLSDGSLVRYEHLISTMPLPVLLELMGNQVPPEVASAAAALRKVSVRSVHIGVGRSALTEKHWIYYPGDTVFHRAFMQGNASPHCNASGGFGLTCEITYSDQKPLPCDGDDLTNLVIRDCIRAGLFKENDAILTRLQVDLPYAYVVFDHQRKACVEVIRGWLANQKITVAGRFGEWEYYNSGECFLSGKKAAEEALRVAVASPERRQSAEIGTAGDAGLLNQVN